MTNKEIARTFQFLGKIMELHGENPFKTRSYSSAYITIRKLPDSLTQMDPDQIGKISGIGKAISSKIQELISTGTLQTLKKYQDMTPIGIQNLLRIKGLGPKKVKTVWDDLGIESPGELLYACNENRLVALKGFGEKTQAQLKAQLEYYFASKGKLHFATAEKLAFELLELLEEATGARFEITGELKRLLPIINQIEVLTDSVEGNMNLSSQVEDLLFDEEKEELFFRDCPVVLIRTDDENWGMDMLESSSTNSFLDALGDYEGGEDEEEIFENLSIPFIASELRENEAILQEGNIVKLDELIDRSSIKGVIHNHSTYSDGVNTIAEMAKACRLKGYDYLVMSDHSKSAFYANGLSIERVEQQWAEIDALNKTFDDFHVFKSMESDILSNGSLDYPNDVLAGFDLVIGSIHSNLKMDINKATTRLIKAIENPFTRILGHPTGRLLLSREGYPIDHKKVIDACAANDVVLELNANPSRLDIDWTWIPYATEKGVMISINPDAHSTAGIDDIVYGVNVARKGMLLKKDCLNTLDTSQFKEWVASK